MSKAKCLVVLGLAGWLIMPSAQAQRPYIGYVYPAGGQQGTTFRVKVGGQGLDGLEEALVSGTGLKVKVAEFNKRLGPQEIQLLNEQLRDLKKLVPKSALASTAKPESGDAMMMMMSSSGGGPAMATDPMMIPSTAVRTAPPAPGSNEAIVQLIHKIERRIREYVQRPACASLADIAFVEVTAAPDAAPGERELRLVTPRGVSNPLPFHIGQVPESVRKPMRTAEFQVLGKEELALRKRPPEEEEVRINLPCAVNGQIASGEVNKYRFQARKGQRIVISSLARQLIPYIADAVPGWFQPVMVLRDAAGNELMYDDDFRFKPDPIILYEVPSDGEYVLNVYDAIYRGREDFVYRITIGELPFVTSIFPLGGRAGAPGPIQMRGWNLDQASLSPPPKDAGSGVFPIAATKGRLVSNRVPFALDTLPECLDKEDNNTPARAQRVQLPIIVNGRMDRRDDADVFQFSGKAGDAVVAEVEARRLESPMDSQIRLTDASGKLLAFCDDAEDLGAGVNTHHADSYIMTKLPADGTYYVRVADTERNGGEEYAYRLRISAAQPDFALRVVPSSIGIRSRSAEGVSVYAIRQDGFTNTITLALKDPPPGFSMPPASLVGTQMVTRVTIKTDLKDTNEPVNLLIEGRAKVGSGEVAHVAVPAEDRMQAFLWRHLVPAKELKALVYDPSYQPPPKRVSKLATASSKP